MNKQTNKSTNGRRIFLNNDELKNEVNNYDDDHDDDNEPIMLTFYGCK